MKSLLRNFVRRLPPNVARLTLLPYRTVEHTIANRHQVGSLYEGVVGDTSVPTRLLCLGRQPQYAEWRYRLFGDAFGEMEPITRPIALRDLLGLGTASDIADVVIVAVNPWTASRFRNAGWEIVPRYVDSIIDLRESNQELFKSRDVKNELRVIRKSRFEFGVLREEADFRTWYDEMLLPTVRLRHRELAHMSNYDALKQVFNAGFLLGAYEGDDWVGANLVVPESGTTIRSANVGWLDGNSELLRKRIVAAILYELINRARAYGFHFVNVGGSNPFATDGPLRFKLKWGARLSLPSVVCHGGDNIEGLDCNFAVWLNLESEGVRALLQSCPVLTANRDGKGYTVLSWNRDLLPEFRGEIDRGVVWRNLSGE